MTYNSFSTKKNKFKFIWNEEETNSIKIRNNADNRTFTIEQINGTTPRNRIGRKFVDLSSDWSYFNISTEDDGITKEIYKTWSIKIEGLTVNQIGAVRYALIFKSGDTILTEQDINSDTTIWTTYYWSLQNNILTFYYGVLLSDTAGLEEFDESGLQVKLNLQLFNPNFFI